MPYKSMDEVNAAIKGIDPPVTLAQANTIAGWADGMEEAEGGPDNPWAAAIAQFKKLYSVQGGKWVKKETKQTDEERGLLRQAWESFKQLFEPHLGPPERAASFGNLYEQAVGALFDSDEHAMAWLHDLYRDDDGSMFIIASERGKLYRVPIAVADEGVALGEWVAVAEEFKPVAQATRTRVIRQADGRHRWLSISCTSVLNRVGEIDSQALFDSFVAHANETGEYPFRTFYHQGEALTYGTADFLARDGDVFITSGLYDEGSLLAEAEIGVLEREAEKWGESINYMPTVPATMVEVIDGVSVPVYKAGKLREVSFLPADKAAAWFTTVRAQEVVRMRADVKEALLKLVDDEELVDKFEEMVDGTNRAIAAEGLVSREAEEEEPEAEAEPTPDPAPEPVEPATSEEDEEDEEVEVEVEHEVELDEAALEKITSEVQGLVAPLAEKLVELEGAMADAVRAIELARETVGARLDVLEKDEDEKKREWLADMPRREKTKVTYRPREANKPTDDEDEEDADAKVQAILDAAVPRY